MFFCIRYIAKKALTSFLVLSVLLWGFIPVFAATKTWDFGNPSDYTFDGAKIEISSGEAQLVASSDWYSGWSYRKKITIDHTKVTGDLVNFPILVSVTDTDLISKAQVSGADIVFTSSDSLTKLDYERESYTSATGALTAWVKVPDISSAVDTVIYLYYGNPVASEQSVPSGVWDANFKTVQHINSGAVLSDSTSNNTDGVFYASDERFTETSMGAEITAHQGVARDSDNYYIFHTAQLKKYDNSWNLLVTHADALTHLGDAVVNHLGDGDYYNGKLYTTAEYWSGACVDTSHQYISVWNSSDLSFSNKIDISAQNFEGSGIAIDPTAGPNGTIYVFSYCTYNKIWKYDLLTGEYLGQITLSRDIKEMQGGSFKNGHFYISSDFNNYVWKVALDGTVEGAVLDVVTAGAFEGIDYSRDDLAVLIDGDAVNGSKIHFYSSAPVLSYSKFGPAGYLDGLGNYGAIPYVLPDNGQIDLWYNPKSPWYSYNSVFDNSVGSGNDWEMWIYNDGRIAGRVNATQTIINYDLDNLGGPDNWYHVVFSWQKTGNNILYVNGVQRASWATSWIAPGSTFYFGGGNAGNNKGKGMIDEVRISDTVRPISWLAAEFASYSSPSTFYDMDPEESLYPITSPSVLSSVSQVFTSISAFSESSTKNGGEIKYQISNDSGVTWYWYNSGWVTTVSGYSESSTMSDINSHISTLPLPLGRGDFIFKAYLNSDGSQLVQLASAGITYINDVSSPILSLISISSLSSVTTISWHTDEASSSRVEYGTTSAYGTSTAETDTATRVSDHSVPLSGLLNCSTYHYRVKSKDAAQNEAIGSEGTFVTSGCSGGSSFSLHSAPVSSVTKTEQKDSKLTISGTSSNVISSIQKVEVSLDDGKTWAQASSYASNSSLGLDWICEKTLSPGTYLIRSKATDYLGVVETPKQATTVVVAGQTSQTPAPTQVVTPIITPQLSVQERISELQILLVSLQAQLAKLQTSKIVFTHDLQRGDTGEDVKQLQAILSKDPSLYPEGIVNGRFGPATTAAVKRFQKKYGIRQTGYVGPLTRGEL